tara:strand:+ start:821 stop:1531 length:711 start_codon:yes stop_codon:yes gene_type:complete
MATQKKKSVFETLSSIDVSGHTEQKGRFTYLSWAWAVSVLLKHFPESIWEVHEWGLEGNRQPYSQSQAGAFVQVTVTVDGVSRTQVHPVLDNKNETIYEPNSFQVNTSIMRCLAKAIALHGLGLYIYAGEDLPNDDAQPTKSKPAKAPQKKGVITGHNPNMKNGSVPSTQPQHNYIHKLREDFMKDFGESRAIKELEKVDKKTETTGLSVKEMSKQQASNLIEELIQGHATLMKGA